MGDQGAVVVVGGTRAIGFEIAKHYVGAGREVVLTGQSAETVDAAVAALGGRATGLVFDLSAPETIAAALASVGPVSHLVLVAIDRDQNAIREYDTAGAMRLTTLKLVGYAEVVHALLDRLDDFVVDRAVRRPGPVPPYPGSTTVTTVNGGVEGLTRALVHELKPIRVNCIHPGIVGNSPYWEHRQAALEAARARTPTGRLVTMADIVAATAFLLESPGLNGVELRVDGRLRATSSSGEIADISAFTARSFQPAGMTAGVVSSTSRSNSSAGEPVATVASSIRSWSSQFWRRLAGRPGWPCRRGRDRPRGRPWHGPSAGARGGPRRRRSSPGTSAAPSRSRAGSGGWPGR